MNIFDEWDLRLSIIPIITAVLGVVANTTCFVIFRFHPEFKNMSSMVFLSFLVVADTLSLFDWNLKHYFELNFNYNPEHTNIFTCKFMPFIQYASLQCSGFLLSFMTIDRFVAIRSTPESVFFNKLPFATTRWAYAWSIGIVCVISVINSHILILNGYYEDPIFKNRTVLFNGSNASFSNATEEYLYQNPNIVCYLYKNGYAVSPQWDFVEMFLYSFIPATIMLTFNILLIYTTLMPNKAAVMSQHIRVKESSRTLAKKRKLTISLLAITFAYIVLTLPSTIGWSFLMDWMYATLPWANLTLDIMDYFSFLNNASVFFTCFLTNKKFRNVITNCCRRKVYTQRTGTGARYVNNRWGFSFKLSIFIFS
jgi:hypothetical protein